QLLNDRHHERARLAGACLRAGDDVVPTERERNDGALNGPRFDEAQVADAFEKPRVEREAGECDRSRVADDSLERDRVGRRAYARVSGRSGSESASGSAPRSMGASARVGSVT